MKRQLVLTLVTVAWSALSATTAFGQSTRIVADVPFTFHVGAQVLPAGVYTVTPVGERGAALAFRNEDRVTARMALADNSVDPKQNGSARLIFHRYGNQYFLSNVFSGGSSRGWEMRASPAEREARASVADPEPTVVLARRSK